MRVVELAADIACPAERVFDLITDLRGQDRWLTTSAYFRGTGSLSANPATLGTTYREPSLLGVRNGTVTEYERPRLVTFHQPMTLRLGLGTIDLTVRYLLTPGVGTTGVRRAVSLTTTGPLRPFAGLLARPFRTESSRTLRALKAYADHLA
jgi:uncharacterized protein YndB with AHSA1/START domain